jgi:DNA-binding HxlR family transcriptional regulator
MVLRDSLLYGLSRFDEFQKNLNISSNMLTTRLNQMVEDGLMERRQYSTRPPRYEYVPTKISEDFRPVLIAMLAWSNRHFALDGVSVVMEDRETGKTVVPVLVDMNTGLPISRERHRYAAGPLASDCVRRRLEDADARFAEEHDPN